VAVMVLVVLARMKGVSGVTGPAKPMAGVPDPPDQTSDPQRRIAAVAAGACRRVRDCSNAFVTVCHDVAFRGEVLASAGIAGDARLNASTGQTVRKRSWSRNQGLRRPHRIDGLPRNRSKLTIQR
jgi:hypothetical protein